MVYRLPFWAVSHGSGLAYGYAILRGGREERLIACVETLVLAAGIVMEFTLKPTAYASVGAIVISLEFAACTTVMFGSNETWLLAYCSTVLVSLLTFLVALAFPISGWAYGTAGYVWNYLECLILVLAATRAGPGREKEERLAQRVATGSS